MMDIVLIDLNREANLRKLSKNDNFGNGYQYNIYSLSRRLRIEASRRRFQPKTAPERRFPPQNWSRGEAFGSSG